MHQESDHQQDAKAAGLRYISGEEPGITRKHSGKGFTYILPNGGKLADKARIQALNALAIPPAYKDVWICADGKGHILATGMDEKGRKQYRYHPDWETARQSTKFQQIRALSDALPAIRRRVTQDLKRPATDKEHVLAGVVALLDTLGLRIGSESYAEENGTFGLSTLQKDHVEAGRTKVHFDYTGKGSKQIEIELSDPRIAKLIHQCEKLPGKRLFQYINGEGHPHPVTAPDVNAYLQEITGQPFTAKDFRTWRACCILVEQLSDLPPPAAAKLPTKKDLLTCIKATAARMTHTPAVCRSNYLHPLLLERYEQGQFTWPKKLSEQQAEAWFKAFLHAA